MHKIQLFLISILLIYSQSTHAQQILEKTHELSGKSKRGNISNVFFNSETGEVELQYLYNTTVNGEARYESYIYDKEFNLVNNSVENGPIMDLAKKDEKSNYKGDSYTVKGVRMDYNLSLKLELSLMQVETKYEYSWDINDYVEAGTSEINRTNLTTEEAAGYVGYMGVEDLHNGGGLFVTALRDKIFGKDRDKYMEYKKFRFLKMDDNMEKAQETSLDLEFVHNIVIQKAIYEDSEVAAMPKLKGIALVLAPAMMRKTPAKAADEWTFLFIDTDGNISRNIGFKVPSTNWDISDMAYDTDKDEFYVYGPANKGVTRKGVIRYYGAGGGFTSTVNGQKKYSMMQIMKVSGDQLAYCNNESLDEMGDKTYNIKGQMKKRVYKARLFENMGVNFMSNGDFMIYGTNYGSIDSTGTKSNYKEAVTIHFGQDGVVRKIYAVKPYEKNYETVPMTNTIINDKAGKYMYWMLEENAGLKSSMSTQGSTVKSGGSITYTGSIVWKYKYLLYPRVIRVDLETATMEEFIPGNKKYFLDNKYPFIQASDDEFIFFGADKKGKNIWFNRLTIN